MSKSIASITVVFLTLALGGCGTACNLSSAAPVPYGGVKDTLARSDESGTAVGFPLNLQMNGVWLGDLFGSAVADTVTMPWVIWRSRSTAHAEMVTPAHDHGYLDKVHARGAADTE